MTHHTIKTIPTEIAKQLQTYWDSTDKEHTYAYYHSAFRLGLIRRLANTPTFALVTYDGTQEWQTIVSQVGDIDNPPLDTILSGDDELVVNIDGSTLRFGKVIFPDTPKRTVTVDLYE